MSQLQSLKSAANLKDLAPLLDFKPSAIAYILYKKPVGTKYHAFDIAKRNGGVRHINAPCDELMLLQKKLCDLLQNCVEEINLSHNWADGLSHGFKRRRSIVTNATKHKRRRYVFNIDIENFFGSINFGRVRGFFIKNLDFKLNPPVATVIAQIASHENALPQGSPCSPVISNLIGAVLDVHLCGLASRCGCTYSRYADDITFSTNLRDFPVEVAHADPLAPHRWDVGKELRQLVTLAGFSINPEKTRMQYRTSRQDVTGLVVNTKVNIRSEYRRKVRAMANHLFKTGRYEHYQTIVQQQTSVLATVKIEGTLPQLHGMLGHIWGIDVHNWRLRSGLKSEEPIERAGDEDQETLRSKERLYRRFLIYRNIYVAEMPTIICEGKTDNIYLVHAIRSLVKSFPLLAGESGGKVKLGIRLFNYTETSTGRIMGLTGGTGSFYDFLPAYQKEITRFTAPGMQQPVILLMDRDKGAEKVLARLKGMFKADTDPSQPFMHVCGNLYVVTTPLNNGQASSFIEDCFTQQTKSTIIGGKTFKVDKAHGENENHYSKYVFAKFVAANAPVIDFTGFSPLLSRITAVIEAHKMALMPIEAVPQS